MLGKKYTIAIDSSVPVEVCCAIYDRYQNDQQFNIPAASYKKYSATYFHSPVIYDTAEIYENLCSKIPATQLDEGKLQVQKNLDTYEADIRMFLKIPAANSSSIVVLEGDYRK